MGGHYVRVLVNGSAPVENELTLRLTRGASDGGEPNDTWQQATPLTQDMAQYYTLPATSDTDYFVFTVEEPDQTVELTLYNPVGGIRYYLYSGADFEAEGDNAGYLTYSGTSPMASGTKTVRYMLGQAGDYYIRLYTGTAFDTDASVTYELIDPDANENNGAWNLATSLPAQQPVSFTLPADNDYDWFALDGVEVGDKVQVTVGGITSGSVTCYLYYVPEGETSAKRGGSATFNASTTESKSFTASQEGAAYFLRVNSSAETDQAMYLQYAVTQDSVAVKGVSLEGGGTTIFAGRTLQLYAKVNPSNAANQAVTWQSSSPAVATVDDSGKVTALQAGQTTITVTTAEGEYSASTQITVAAAIPVSGVKITAQGDSGDMGTQSNPKSLTLDTSIQLTAHVYPSYANNPTLIWSSSDPSVAQVDGTGKVTPVSAGEATITVAAQENTQLAAQCLVSVQPERVRAEGISFETESVDVGLYASITLKPVFEPAGATDQSVTWKSSNNAVATVSRTEAVTAIGLGSATITATSNDGGHTASIQVNVNLTAGYGDVSNDGIVDVGDALLVLQYSVGLQHLTQDMQQVADVNGDQYVDAADAILILRYDAGLIQAFPVEQQ